MNLGTSHSSIAIINYNSIMFIKYVPLGIEVCSLCSVPEIVRFIEDPK